MSRCAIYPGSFDPITYGHLDLIKRATVVFEDVIVGVAENTQKNTLFSIDERVDMVKETTGDIGKVRVESFKGLVIDYARSKNVHILIRGVRMFSDFEYELQMALTNRRLDETIETVFLMPSEGHSFLSSTLIKEGVLLGADVSTFVPRSVAARLKEKLNK
jgi:pantetheine-phosphate adenylyltransferase